MTNHLAFTANTKATASTMKKKKHKRKKSLMKQGSRKPNLLEDDIIYTGIQHMDSSSNLIPSPSGLFASQMTAYNPKQM